MPKVREDEFGLYVESGGYVARPLVGVVSRFSVGQTVVSRHFAGSGVHGVGRGEECQRGEYVEYWQSTGDCSQHPSHGGTPAQHAELVAWYREHCSTEAWMRARAQELRRARKP